MGTSKSGTGPGPGVPLTPSWVPDPANPGTSPQSEDAPARRFGSARTCMGRFAREGSREDMLRGLGHYVKKGYSGWATMARRMGGTARAAGALYGALSSAAAGKPVAPGRPFNPALLAGRSANEIMDALVEEVWPVDGTQDAEAGRDAMKTGLSELRKKHRDADLLNLSKEQRLLAIRLYIAQDVLNRFDLDIGMSVQGKGPNDSPALRARIKNISDYVRETVAERFCSLLKTGEQLDAHRVSQLAYQTLQKTFSDFESNVR